MRQLFAGALTLVVLLAAVAIAQEVPTENPREVWVKGRLILHSWRDGRIFVDTDALKPLLNLDSEIRQMDLLKALEEKGGYIWAVTDGKFEAKRDPSLYGEADPTRARRTNQNSAAIANQQLARKQAEKTEPYLVYHVKRFTADTGYVRAYVTIGNEGGSPSPPSTAVCQFQDGFGKTYAEHTIALPPINPGELHQIEAFSLVEVKDTSITSTADNVAVNFFSDSSGPESMTEARKEARARKRSRL